MTKKDHDNIGTLTWTQSAKLWWSIVWRCLIVSLVPLTILVFMLNKILDETIVAIISNIIIIIIFITIQRHVINKIAFSDFSLDVSERSVGET